MVGRLLAVAVLALGLVACGDDDDGPTPTPTARMSTMTLTSEAFEDGEPIPVEFTCDGENVSPPLAWTDPPEGAQSLALVMDDPEAPGGDFTHWLVFNIPPDVRSLERAAGAMGLLPEGAVQGENNAGELGYFGPCPPRDEHTYEFRIVAIDKVLELEEGATRAEFSAEVEDHVLDRGVLTGVYER